MIYDLPEYFMMTWEELMGIAFAAGYDIWSEDTIEFLNYQTSTHGGRYFKPQLDNPTSIYVGRHFKPQSDNTTSIYRERHVKPPHLEIDNLVKALNKATQQTPTK